MLTVIVSGDACQVQASVTTVRRLIVIGTSAPPAAVVRAGVATMSDSVHGPVGSARTGSGGAVSTGRFFLPFLPFLPAGASAVGPAVGAAVVVVLAPACVALASSLPSAEPPRTRASTTTSSTGTTNTMRRRVQ